MGVWGIGTSRTTQERLGLTQSVAAALLAVGSLVIPALDSLIKSPLLENFFYEVRMHGWGRRVILVFASFLVVVS